uniref:Retrotransposon gag domain-containing protein n=1 Tax=Magallana gigas TaxID=29159 RepID=A0A8W8I4T9_MAGGI
MPPKRTSQARAKPSTVSKQKKRRTSMNLEVVSPALSPDVLETITAQVTQRVTATIRDELTTLINNINSNSASNSQGSISINPIGASNNDDNDGLVRESRYLDNAIQHSVEAVVVDHTEKIAGKCPTGFVSTAVPIDARVSDQTKLKIWSNQYIEFASLLSKDKQKKGKLSIQVEDGDSPGKLTIHQVENDSQSEVTLSSMHDWLTAWNRFAAIYCIKYPEQQAKLAKHLESVRDIADAKGNLKAYDTDFRMLVAQGQVSWGDVHIELYVNARLRTALSSKPNKSHKDMSYSSMPEVSVSSTIQVRIVQQACLVASNTDVITAAGHTLLFNVQSKPSSPFGSCRGIKTKQVVQIQGNNITNQNHLVHPSKGPTPIKALLENVLE